MKTIDFNKNDFPLTSTVLGFMQAAYQMLELFGNIVGSKFILSGAVEGGGPSYSPGVVYIDGELMPFDGGYGQNYVRVITTNTENVIQDGSYTETNKKLVFGTGTGQFLWSDVKRFDSVLAMMTKLESKASQIALTSLTNTVANKVDKVTGKALSANDFTNTLLDKLNGIAQNANNYVHPGSHPISMITDLNTQLASKMTRGYIHTFSRAQSDPTYQLPNNANIFIIAGGVVGDVIDVYLPIAGGVIQSGSMVRILWTTDQGYDGERLDIYPPPGYTLYPNAVKYNIVNRESIEFQLEGTMWYPVGGARVDYDN